MMGKRALTPPVGPLHNLPQKAKGSGFPPGSTVHMAADSNPPSPLPRPCKPSETQLPSSSLAPFIRQPYPSLPTPTPHLAPFIRQPYPSLPTPTPCELWQWAARLDLLAQNSYNNKV